MIRSFPPTREEVRAFCYDVLGRCAECAPRNYQEDQDFEPCDLCASLIESTLREFSGKLRRVVPILKACRVCREKIDAELAHGLLTEHTALCDACATAVMMVYRGDLN